MIVIKKAKCVLKGCGSTWETTTDAFGDFWFKNLPVGEFELTIEADGFQTKCWNKIETTKSVNIGDIPFDR